MLPPKYMTAKQAADYLHLEEQTLAVWRVNNVGPDYIKMPRRVLYAVTDLDDYLEQRKVRVRPKAAPTAADATLPCLATVAA